MSIGMAMARNEYGSLLGATTAATTTMITMAGRRHFRHFLVGTAPEIIRNTRTIGKRKTPPKMAAEAKKRLTYFWGPKRGATSEPLTEIRKSRALGNTRMDVVTPRLNRR